MVSFCGQCLVAMPKLKDERFFQSVVYVCAHTHEGAMGLTINRPIKELSFAHLLAQIYKDVSATDLSPPILAGGPLDIIRGFVLHSPEYKKQTTLPVASISSLTLTTDILKDIALGSGPDQFLITLGYSGWGAGQLEQEIKQNAWLTVDATTDLLFATTPEKKWIRALNTLGIDPALLSCEQGNA